MGRLLTVWNFVRRHKYQITVLAFIAIVGFIDENSYVRRLRNKREISRLENEIRKYREEYNESTRLLNELEEDPTAIEKIAREKYFMKKPNEDIFIFKE